MTRPLTRCALYTRKSSEEGLDQDFNSLDAQREAAAAYVKSQAGEGWRALAHLYDDGGYSGGTMERPGLKALLADIALGKVDVVVVYKIDRLTRCLTDFARMVEIFDRHGVSFVSVTQAFNTTTSMGRLTLNVLLSFAQFEREVTGERIRDKIAASKARGMWMGGRLPLGYDRPREGSRALVTNPLEAETVRLIFETYLQLGSVHALEHWLDARAIRSKSSTTASGKRLGGRPFSRGALFHLLRNRTYLGKIVHRGVAHPGQHPALLEDDLFDAVQRRLDANRRTGNRAACPAQPDSGSAPAPLTGRIFDADGHPMTPAWTRGGSKRIYRYYVSAPLQQGRKRQPGDTAIRRIAAPALEARIGEVLTRILPQASGDHLAPLRRVTLRRGAIDLDLVDVDLASILPRLAAGETAEPDDRDPDLLHVALPFEIRRRGGRTEIVTTAHRPARADPVLVRALRAAHAMLPRDHDGLPRLETSPANPYRRTLIRLAFLAPDIQCAILEGRQASGLDLAQLLDAPIPLDWTQQRQLYLPAERPA